MTEEHMTASEVAQFRAEGLRLHAEAAEMLKRAEAKDRDGDYKLGQSDWRLREVQALEANISRREAALKAAGEPEFLAREKAADEKLRKAEELMAAYNKDWHAGAIAFQQINEREKAREAAA